MRSCTLAELDDPKRQADKVRKLVYGLYHCGAGYPEGHCFGRNKPGQAAPRSWQNAEEFLAVLDEATTDGESRGAQRARGLLSATEVALGHLDLSGAFANVTPGLFGKESDATWQQVLAAATEVVADECDFFRDGDLGSERALPYRAWAKTLTAQDTIVSFNYDRVVELVCGDQLAVASPANPALAQEKPNLLKLHGSIDPNWGAGALVAGGTLCPSWGCQGMEN